MQTLEKVLADLYKAGTISFEAAMSKTSKPDEVQRLIGSAPPKASAAKSGTTAKAH
jgi:twitching motility protein PilT